MNQPQPGPPSTLRFSVDFPHGVLPDGFAVVSSALARGPEDITPDAPLDGSDLASVLDAKGWKAYPAVVESPVFNNEPRVSFAVVETLAKLERVMRDFCRPQLFWVQRGMVHQTFFGAKKPICLGPYDRFSGRPPVEKDVLAILARRGANLIWVPARDVPSSIDAVFKAPMEEQRLLILSPFLYGRPSRPTKETCALRNRFVLRRASNRYIPFLAPGSSLADDLLSSP